MIPDEVVRTINDLRSAYAAALGALDELESFATVRQTTPPLRAELADLARVLDSPHLREPCTGRVTCAILGSSGHGKTTILDEMFPSLSRRGWLETDVTDTTSQSLRIRHAAPGAPELDSVVVHSWSTEQIVELMRHADVDELNATDGIHVTYHDDAVVVDGSAATLDPRDLGEWRFPRRVELRPLPRPYEVPSEKIRDRGFIRALTVKEQSSVLKSDPVLEFGGRRYDALQLRAIVKDVTLADDFERIAALAGRDIEAVSKLTFVDTPGLATGSVAKDEVLRHFLGRKSNQIALQLLRDDELDIVVHLVLCGQKSQFESLWAALERECGRAEMEQLADRMILAVNGANIFFTNPDVRAKYEDPATAAREGDQFAATLEDNILQRISPRGQIRPARICFLDSRRIVDGFADYAEFYARHRRVMEGWTEPGGSGHETLARLGLVESFRDNIDALADADDRGQGMLVRQILDLIESEGPRLMYRKYLVRTGLLRGLDELRDVLGRYYDADGAMNAATVRDTLQRCLAFLDPDDLSTIETFAVAELDPHIEGLVPDGRERAAESWVAEAFRRACELVKEAILDASSTPIPEAVWSEFARHFDARTSAWAERWGYRSADLPPPHDAAAGTTDLVVHCLRIHAREILYQLLGSAPAGELRGLEQSEDDKQRVRDLLRQLDDSRDLGRRCCARNGVQPS